MDGRRRKRREIDLSRPSHPERLGEILKDTLDDLGLLNRRVDERLRRAWIEVSGTTVAARTRVLSFQSGRLTIEVGSAALLQELQNFRKRDILRRLQQEFPNPWVSELRFRQGAVSTAERGGSRRA